MKSFEDALARTEEVGYVEELYPSLVKVGGLPKAKLNEVVLFESGDLGKVYSLTEESVEVLLFTNQAISIGMRVARTDQHYSIGVGDALVGTMIDPFGRFLSGATAAGGEMEMRTVDIEPPLLMSRRPVTEPFECGVSIADLVVPLGKGQRELVIGDRKIGKLAFLRTAALAHASRGGICVYAAIAKRYHEIKELQNYFEANQIQKQVVIVATSSRDTPGLVFYTPYTAMTIAEYFKDQGKDVLVIMDDLTVHAKYYREIALMAKRFPGRSAYPGDIFYVHAKLMERAGNFEKGSITALPVAETVLGDISGYIQTNLMSMTDGHIYFDREMYNQGKRPAINAFLSVTRVGHQAQSPLLKTLSRELSRFLSTLRQTQELLHFGGELGDQAKKTLAIGRRIEMVFSQDRNRVVPVPINAVVMAGLWAGFWESWEEIAFRDRYAMLIEAYLSNQEWQRVIDSWVAGVNDFQSLVELVTSQQAALEGNG
jgi:F-type H+/Na+-transporting ATPase subunit alpha